jgi:hypothetical protein
MKSAILILIFCFLNLKSQAQNNKQIGLQDLGKTYYTDVKNSYSIKPCEETTGKALTYCVSDGSKVSYMFTNYKLTSIVNFTAYPLKYRAEAELERLINEQSRKMGIQPYYSNGMALFKTNNSNIILAFQVIEISGTYYLGTYFTLPD